MNAVFAVYRTIEKSTMSWTEAIVNTITRPFVGASPSPTQEVGVISSRWKSYACANYDRRHRKQKNKWTKKQGSRGGNREALIICMSFTEQTRHRVNTWKALKVAVLPQSKIEAS